VWADPVRLRQIASNLLANAVQYTPPGGEVMVELAPLEEGVRLTFRDTGRGLSSDDLPRVFTTLWREDEARPGPTGGLGLGLAIVQQLVEAHGGEIHAESAGLGRGTAFVIHLRAAPVRPPSAIPPSLGGARILVVDDDPASAQGLAQHLGRAGAQVAVAASASAWEALQTARPEVLLLNLPPVPAEALVQRLQTTGAGPRVVALGTTEHPGVGASLHLPHPVEPHELVSHLLRFLQTQPRLGF
jgi:CheY-like chemotaxis protein